MIISTRLEYERNRWLWRLIAQSVPAIIGALILFIYFFSLLSNSDHVDFMSTVSCPFQLGIGLNPDYKEVVYTISIVWQILSKLENAGADPGFFAGRGRTPGADPEVWVGGRYWHKTYAVHAVPSITDCCDE
jgi:hypothetical protein